MNAKQSEAEVEALESAEKLWRSFRAGICFSPKQMSQVSS